MKTCCMMVAGPFEKDYWREWAVRRGLPRPDNGQLRDISEFVRDNHNEVAWPYLAKLQASLNT